MEIKIRRTYKGKTTVTYNMSYKKNKSFKSRDWKIRFRKETYGWGFSEIVLEENFVEGRYGYGGSLERAKTLALPREIILKIENIIRGLNSNNGLV